jgi:diguanylate cyclase (GGDEF)-like protein/PAS domain S-box-containing protein
VDSGSEIFSALESGDLYRDIVDEISEGVYIMDLDGRIAFWNRGAFSISGYEAGEVVGKRCSDNILVHVDERARPLCTGACPARLAMEADRINESDIYLRHKDGHRVPVHVRVTPVRDREGEVVGGIEVFSDNRASLEDRARIAELERLSMLDPVTGISNRRHAESYLDARLAELQRYSWSFGLVYFDIDHFKKVNDTWGHEVGDQVLRMVARTAGNSLRSTDVVSRWGGEEFTGAIQRVEAPELLNIAETMRLLVEGSALRNGDGFVSVTVSCGCTIARPDDTIESLVARADRLMYASKEAGRNRVTAG